LAVLLCACSLIRDQTDPTTVSIRGVQPTLEQLNVGATANAQNQFVNELIQTAGLSSQPAPRSEDWDLVTRAGVYEIGRQCDQYLDALFRFNREQRAGRQDLAAAAAATGAIMGLSHASAKALAITAAAFGLASSLFDASVNSVLFTIDPSALRNVALQGRKKYLDDLKNNNVKIDTRPDMLIVLQGYLTQCSPAALEANINNAASGAPSVVSPLPGVAEKAAALAAPSSTTLAPPTALVPQVQQREERAKEAAGQKVTTEPLKLAENLAAQHLDPSEGVISKRVITNIQNALGVKKPDGDPGLADGRSETRTDIREFQDGMIARGIWQPAEKTGKLSGRTFNLLSTLSPMPKEFMTPFERAYLGNSTVVDGNKIYTVPDVKQLNGVSTLLLSNLKDNPELKGKVAESVLADYSQRFANKNLTADDQLKLMRDMVADNRKFLLHEPDPQRRDLDSIFFNTVLK
jgi:hypothetical protein